MKDIAFGRQIMSATWQQHTHAEFVLKDADTALATMTANPYVLCIPSGMGGTGRAGVREFYARQFLPNIPPLGSGHGALPAGHCGSPRRGGRRRQRGTTSETFGIFRCLLTTKN
jgi:hypothetical protein